jgi:hypothetical protein
METLELMLKDPPTWAAVALFLFSFSVFLWSVTELRARSAGALMRKEARMFSGPDGSVVGKAGSPPAALSPALPDGGSGKAGATPVDKKTLWNSPPSGSPAIFPLDTESTQKLAAAAAKGAGSTLAPPVSPLLPGRSEPAVGLSALEEKFTELAKRLVALEHIKKETPAPSYLEPLLKRVQEVESEVKNLKFSFTQLAAAQNAVNVADITAKIQGVQKILEHLTGGTDVSKPS